MPLNPMGGWVDERTLKRNYIAPELRYGMLNAPTTNQRK